MCDFDELSRVANKIVTGCFNPDLPDEVVQKKVKKRVRR
jgi:hypothetical protein